MQDTYNILCMYCCIVYTCINNITTLNAYITYVYKHCKIVKEKEINF